MKKTSKFILILCFAGTLSLSIDYLKNDDFKSSESTIQNGTSIVRQLSALHFNEKLNVFPGQLNKGDSITIVTPEEQKIIESMGNAIPLANYDLSYYQRQDGTGFLFKKAQNVN